MPRKLLLPASRRSTFRAPDPEAAARFDLALPGANAESDRRPADELAELAELRTESIATAIVEQRMLVEERLLAELAADRDAAAERRATLPAAAPRPEAARTSFVSPSSEDRADDRAGDRPGDPGHPRHRADRIGNRRPTSGRRRPLLAG